MNLKRKSFLLFILAFIIFIGTNETSYAKVKKKSKVQKVEVEEYEDFEDIRREENTAKFKADTEKEYEWAKDKTKAEILKRAEEKWERGDKTIKIFLINDVTFNEAMALGFNKTKYIQWGQRKYTRKNGEVIMFVYYEKI